MRTNIIGIKPAEQKCFPSHIQWTGDNRMLSPPEVEAVIRLAESQELRKGTIGNGDRNQGVENAAYRCVETCALEGCDWLYERIVKRAQWANDEHYRFDLSGIVEPIGFLKYTPSTETQPAGHYDWHQDFGGGPYSTRKLSVVVQLSAADEYAGCELQLCTDGPWSVQYKAAGDAIMFPSWTPHRVTNIERGTRRALVVWIHGPQYR